MVKNSRISNNEVNLIELMQTVWKGKWKIAVAVVISIIAVTSYQSIKIKNFNAVTEIKPISTLAINKYIILNHVIKLNEAEVDKWTKIFLTENNFNFQQITKSTLLALYIEILEEKKLFEDAIHKFNILDASQYSDEQAYNEAIIQLASSIRILRPSDILDKSKDQRNGRFYSERSYHSIHFKINDIKKWKNVLVHVDELANQLVKQNLLEDFNEKLIGFKSLKEFMVTNLKQEKKNQLEDLSVSINNLLDDYDRNISDRLAYLKEQTEIAKELGISNSTIESQTFDTQGVFMTSMQTNNPFYLRGFKAIDKEIELISSRVDKRAFVEELPALEKNLRELKQDKTIERIENKGDSIDSYDLLKETLALSPLGDGNDFNSSSLNVLATKFNNKDNSQPMLSLAIIIGLLFGVFYVFITNELKYYKAIRKK